MSSKTLKSDGLFSYHHALVKALTGIALILTIGTLGYRFIEGWSYLDGFYMTVITITGIGFKEVHDPTFYGRIFTLFIIFSGVGVVAYAIVTGSQMIIEGELTKILTRRRSMKAIEKLKDHFIICGFGRMGSFICDELHARQIPFVVVETKQDTQDKIMQIGYYLSPGDATEEEVLLAAGIRNAKGFVSVLDSDAANVYAVLTARELNQDLEIIARAGEEAAAKKLVRAGANRVISPYKIGGMRLVMSILKPAVMNFLEVAMDHKQYDIEIEEVGLHENSCYSGKRLVDTDIRKGLNLIIIAIKKKDGQMVFNPGPYTVMDADDTLIAMGEKKNLSVLEREASERAHNNNCKIDGSSSPKADN
ncbi:MAG: potassium channel protein [Desulfomonile tiedjei]|uniref:Potassium channel protein n=1 Tax=Desulfomonile tiedjei TaxID=2358 RepID=A0A9D6Z6Q6_9BACT|nr:potassium channel protein [Desulfomonile tiedjei]